MANYTIAVSSDAWTSQVDTILSRISRVDSLLDELADDVVLPILARHYDMSGIKQNRPTASLFGGSQGVLRQAVTKRGAMGNVIVKSPGKLIVGVSYEQIPYAKWVIEGRGPVRAKRAKMLHWVDENGKDIFRKSVGPAPPHPIYFLTGEELGQLEEELSAMVARSK